MRVEDKYRIIFRFIISKIKTGVEFMSDIPKNIKKHRKEFNISQEELAKKLYVTRQTISNYENGKSNPDIETLQQLAEIFNTDIDSLLYGEHKPRDKTEIKKTVAKIIFIALIAVIIKIIEVKEMEVYHRYYIFPLFSYSVRTIGYPIFLVITGAIFTKFIMLITLAKPIKINNKKIYFRIILISFIGYLILVLPRVIDILFPVKWDSRIEFIKILNQIYYAIWVRVNSYQLPGLYGIFVIIGVFLYLTYDRN